MPRALQNKGYNRKKMESYHLDQLSSSKGIKKKNQEFKASYTFADMFLEDACSLNRNELSPRFVSNIIHTKTRLDKLQGNGAESKLSASRGWSQ